MRKPVFAMAMLKNALVKSGKMVEAFTNEMFEQGFATYFDKLGQNKISLVLNSRERNIKLASVTYRQLNSWDDKELLTTERVEENSWRKFSIIDALWIKIIQELRSFGLSTEQIKVAKDSLAYGASKHRVAMPILEFYIAFAIGNKMPVLLLVFKDGVAVPTNYTQYRVAQQLAELENHIQINLNKLLQSLFPDVDLTANHNADLLPNVDEMELLAFLRIGNYEKVEIFYKGGKMQVLEGLERLDADKLVMEAIREHSYQKIEVVVENGKTVALNRKVKKKIKKG